MPSNARRIAVKDVPPATVLQAVTADPRQASVALAKVALSSPEFKARFGEELRQRMDDGRAPRSSIDLGHLAHAVLERDFKIDVQAVQLTVSLDPDKNVRVDAELADA